MQRKIIAEPLTAAAFKPFGEVLEIGGESISINNGTAERFHARGRVDVADENGEAVISLFRGQNFDTPIEVIMFERHPLGSQAFFPLSNRSYLVVVAGAAQTGEPEIPKVFLAGPQQGINLHKGIWHHPLIALYGTSDFLIVDRDGHGNNLEEVTLPQDSRFLAELLENS